MLAIDRNLAFTEGLTEELNIIETSPYFQRAIALEYDLMDAQLIDFFVPTATTVEAISKVLEGTEPKSHDRSHVLLGAYGTGKSLVGLVLGAILNPKPQIFEALKRLCGRLNEGGWKGLASKIESRLLKPESSPRLLPLVLSGDEGELATALMRSCQRALLREEISDEILPSIFNDALQTLTRWKEGWPDIYAGWENLTELRLGKSAKEVEKNLEQGSPEAYQGFCELYPDLTGGAVFDPFSKSFNGRIVEVLTQLATALKKIEWDGLLIIWDEFGRFLEERASEPFGKDAQLLQGLAECCARSGTNQINLVLITHKSLRQYGRGLAGGVDKEWSKIEGRFGSVEIASDPQMVYGLIERGIRPTNSGKRDNFIQSRATELDTLMEGTTGCGLFLDVGDVELRRLIVEGSYPLHPVATYCLPRLSDRVAQNQRTLFTFLVTDDENGLLDVWQRPDKLGNNLPIVLAGRLFDYFASGIRAATEPGGVHWAWSAVERAANKLPNSLDGSNNWLLLLVKTLAVLHVARAYDGGAPSTELIAFAVGATTPEELRRVDAGLEQIAALRLIRYRKLYGGWEFMQWLTDLDIEQEVTTRLQEQPPTPVMLRTLLSLILPPPIFQARRYNDHRGMIRYFHAQYRTVHEIEADVTNPPNWDALLVSLDYADGLILYVPCYTGEELDRAKSVAIEVSKQHSRILCVLPSSPLPARGPLEDLYGLKQLRNDPILRLQEVEAVKELNFFEEDARLRLERSITGLLDPRQGASWYRNGLLQDSLNSPGSVSKLLSEMCETAFNCTPRIYNESLNKRTPASVQMHASEKVADAILADQPTQDLGLTGYGPDVAIMNTVLKATGILSNEGIVAPPDETLYPEMSRIWGKCEAFYQKSSENQEGSNFDTLLDELQKPPYGLRRGVLPLILAATFKKFASSATVRRSGISVPVNGATFTEITTRPAIFTVQVGIIDERNQALLRELELRIGIFIRLEERKGQRLRILALGLLRWLQSLPRYARDTQEVSKSAANLRRLIRNVSNDPIRSLLVELPRLVEGPQELFKLMDELEQVYDGLLEHVTKKIADTFNAPGEIRTEAELAELIAHWYNQVKEGSNVQHLFSDPVAEELARIGREPNKYEVSLIDTLCKKVVGSVPRDWNDELTKRFSDKLAQSCNRLEREVAFLRNNRTQLVFPNENITQPTTPLLMVDASQVVELILTLPEDGQPRQYRFLKSGQLSNHGHQLAESLQRTIDISGRSLDIEEKRTIALELLRYILEGKPES